jgi:hypothetical protein
MQNGAFQHSEPVFFDVEKSTKEEKRFCEVSIGLGGHVKFHRIMDSCEKSSSELLDWKPTSSATNIF